MELNLGEVHVNCECVAGFSGDTCKDLDPCGTDPCFNELEENGCINDRINNDYTCVCLSGWSGKNCDEVEEDDSPFAEFLEDLMELLDPNGPIATPVATIGVLGKSSTYIKRLHR